MDLQQINTDLADLQIDLKWESDPPRLAAQLPDQRARRAMLYIQYLHDAETFFSVNLARPVANQGLGDGYAFVSSAFAAAGFLTPLAQMLDRYVAPGVATAIPAGQTYEAFFDGICGANDAAYVANRANFFTTYPLIGDALQALTNNFKTNIQQACTRVLADRDVITRCFSDRYWFLSLTGLTRIKSSGSDFHKGGKQVLFLTFSISYFSLWPRRGELKVVYKPTDLDIDCRLVGDSAAAARALGTAVPRSVCEIVNDQIEAVQRQDPQSHLVPLPTYRIVPVNPVSATPFPAAPVPVRQAYGYMEFLSHDLTLGGVRWRNYYPLGASDWVIFPRQDAGAITQRLYRQLGVWSALAATLSLKDLHAENVRLRGYQAHLIDLEICLTSAIGSLDETLLVETGTSSGGINGFQPNDQDDFVWFWDKGPHECTVVGLERTRENRLYRLGPQGKQLVPVDLAAVLQGLRAGLDVLGVVVQGPDFMQWQNRLVATNVLVRVITLSTGAWQDIRNAILGGRITGGALDPDYAGLTLKAAVWSRLNAEYATRSQNFVAGQPPRFAAVDPAASGDDLENVDIPAFYHRVGSSDIVDSRGNTVLVDQNIVGRTTYFSAPPTAANVFPQILALAGAQGPQQRFAQLSPSVVNSITGSNVNDAGQFIP